MDKKSTSKPESKDDKIEKKKEAIENLFANKK